jgi:hypothetical protein
MARAQILLNLLAAVALLSALASAETKVKTETNQEHHGKLSKVAFWKHGKKTESKAKPVNTKTQPKPKQAAATVVKPKPNQPVSKKAQAKKSTAKLTSVKSTSTKQSGTEKNGSAKSARKAVKKSVPPASKAKPQAKAKQDATVTAKK